MNVVMNQASHWVGVGAVELHGWFVFKPVLAIWPQQIDKYSCLVDWVSIWSEEFRYFENSVD
jgi:hypothetical protein